MLVLLTIIIYHRDIFVSLYFKILLFLYILVSYLFSMQKWI